MISFCYQDKFCIDSDQDAPFGATLAQEGEMIIQNLNNIQGNQHHQSPPSQ